MWLCPIGIQRETWTGVRELTPLKLDKVKIDFASVVA